MLKDNTSHGLRSSLATVCSMPWHRGPGRAQSLRPSKGRELTSPSLSAALCHKLSFTKAEWDSSAFLHWDTTTSSSLLDLFACGSEEHAFHGAGGAPRQKGRW